MQTGMYMGVCDNIATHSFHQTMYMYITCMTLMPPIQTHMHTLVDTSMCYMTEHESQAIEFAHSAS